MSLMSLAADVDIAQFLDPAGAAPLRATRRCWERAVGNGLQRCRNRV
eukprot:gene21495-47023_t